MSFFDDAPIIHSYSRADAISDGFLVDVSTAADVVGFAVPVALTKAAWVECVHWPQDQTQTIQDDAGRLHDVLFRAAFAAKIFSGSNCIAFSVLRIPADGVSVKPTPVLLSMSIGPGDTSDPVITIGLSDES